MGLGLGVGAVQLDIAEGPLGLGAFLLHPRRQVGPLAPDRQRPEDTLGRGEGPVGPLQLALHTTASGERPLRHHDGLALGVVQRVLGEP